MTQTAEIASEIEGRAQTSGGLKVKIVVLAAIFVGGLALFRWTPLSQYANPEAIAGFFRGLGTPWWSPFVFVPLYAFGVAFGMPGTIPTLAGGAIFGVARGMLYNTIAANLGALLAFLLARYLGRDFVARIIKGRSAALDQKIGEHGFGTILYLRLIPLVPFNALNFAAGISRVSPRDYVLGSLIGMLPGTLVYTYFADALIRGTGEARREAFLHFLAAAALLVAFTVITGWIRRRRGSNALEENEAPE
ncbi:MAG: TVP38/TMEM64 family protein [Gemmatimonadota bacterium]|nr:MAG: TVP38/TMEM64 family protein [Gemmatimonadota bacterium]